MLCCFCRFILLCVITIVKNKEYHLMSGKTSIKNESHRKSEAGTYQRDSPLGKINHKVLVHIIKRVQGPEKLTQEA